jgi:hypothetical protein
MPSTRARSSPPTCLGRWTQRSWRPWLGQYRIKTPEQAAATSVLVATAPQLEGIGGRYFEDCNEAPVVDPSGADFVAAGVAAYALDPCNAKRLWDLSLRMLEAR